MAMVGTPMSRWGGRGTGMKEEGFLMSRWGMER
jgi:hypothetical protein